MAEPSCGGSVYACATRVAVLEQDGVPLPGAGNLYTTDTLVKMEATPVFYTPPEIEVPNACGNLIVVNKPTPVLKRFDLSFEAATLDAELENMMVGGEIFTSAGVHVGGSAPQVGVVGAPNGVSIELWSKHILNGDIDPTWPYIHWVWPRSKWIPEKVTWDQNHMPRLFSGFSSENSNWFNGPANDWTFASDRSYAWAFTKTLPATSCGSTTLSAS